MPRDDSPMDAGAPPRRLRLAVIGAAGGLLSGMFGVGGGILMVPLLVGFGRMDQRHAAATSLAAIVPASVAGATSYALAGQVDWLAALFVAAGGVTGSFLGARLLRRLPLGVLRWAFIALLIVVAARMALVAPPRGGDGIDFAWWTPFALFGIGILIGIASGLFGIGGGVVAVPALVALFGAGDLVAKGTSLAIMLPTAASGTFANVRAGLVDLRAGAVVGLAATICSLVGVSFAFLVPAEVSGWLFAALLVIAAVQLTVRALRGRHR
ncbi:sulfite exporter TauE/SafE family protein [Agromyces archimandritae]|uniref:Probable membrane transporter protein n=1 Tax=Agromyces archimandritae TaxID=2781962 RepID=A0A975IQM8_9MICO|nr:sulfite exporter TauE/SafE family protein [Agromyces archimandritae]QTX05211.1 sulfite exporter TauE/SafE family protein [Agromyces archimandritae]